MIPWWWTICSSDKQLGLNSCRNRGSYFTVC